MSSVKIAVCSVFAAVSYLSALGDGQVRTYGNNEPKAGVPRSISPEPRAECKGVSPIGLGLVTGLQAPSPEWDVWMLRISIFAGCNRNVYAIDIGGLGNTTEYEMGGIAVSGIFNIAGSSCASIQTAGLFNRVYGDFNGAQIAGAMSYTEGRMTGFQFGIVTRANRLDGVQTGLFNIAGKGSGVQIGIVNRAKHLEGLQIGLANFISDSSPGFMPFVNFSF